MYRLSLFLTATLLGTTIALVQPAASAKSASEIEAIARAVTVEINFKFRAANGEIKEVGGSGVIIDRKGDLYTLVTNRHVVCGGGQCSQLPPVESYKLSLADSQQYQVKKSNIKLLDNDLDLAVIQFRSSRNYIVAKVATSGILKVEDDIYTAGFPLEQPGFTFRGGKVVAVVNKRLVGDSGGYTVIYDAFTLPGMSGGGVFNSSGQLVAIHGQGDRFKENTELNDDIQSRVGEKIGYNRGIPVRWLTTNLAKLGIYLSGGSSTNSIRAARQQVPDTADEYFIAGFSKLVEPGNDILSGKRLAIQQFSKAIQLNPKYEYAYFVRAIAYNQIQDPQKSLSDFNQVIVLNPKNSNAYINRANLKKNKFNDIQGALADFNQAIILNPESSDAFNNRANLKYENLNDIQGALSDFNQAISLNPKFSVAYNNRANLKDEKLNDIQGALSDYNQAISLNPKFSAAYNNRALLKDEKLNDTQGALDDYNQTIILNPKFSAAYYNRANLKYNRLNDIQGALSDFNQAIILNPKYSNAYYNRAILKYVKLNDRTGAIQDFRQAARLYREQGETRSYQKAIDALRQLGATE
jgi:tetratricopeptide (TPR) repeat protein